jgi:hypothetical protein
VFVGFGFVAVGQVQGQVEVPAGSYSFESWLKAYPKTKYRNFALGWFRWLSDVYYAPEKNPIVDFKVQNALTWIRGKLTKLTWDELVRVQKLSDKEDQKFSILETLEYYVNNILRGSYGYKLNTISSLRSFFSWNRAPLPADPQFRIRADYETQPGKLTADVARDIIKACKLRDRSLYLTKWMTFLDWEGLQYLNTHYGYELGQQVKKGRNLLGPFWQPGRKQFKLKQEGRFYNLIGLDAANSLREYFETERQYPQKGEPIWLPQSTAQHEKLRPLGKEDMGQNWLGMVRRLGLAPNQQRSRAYRTGFGGHETRDAASSLIHKAKLQGFDLDVAEFFKGHVAEIDPNKYDRFYLDLDYVTNQYKIIEPYLNIISNNPNASNQTGNFWQAFLEAAEKDPAGLKKLLELTQGMKLGEKR